jgi:hypothetical protein
MLPRIGNGKRERALSNVTISQGSATISARVAPKRGANRENQLAMLVS